MRIARSKYPVGATWEAKERGMVARIWLRERCDDTGLEFWHWAICHESDGSGAKFDWGTSYAMVREAVPIYHSRFKRVKTN